MSLKVTWDQAPFSYRFENDIPAGKAKRKESLIVTFYETSAAHFFSWLTFAESANQNYFRCLFFFVSKFFIGRKPQAAQTWYVLNEYINIHMDKIGWVVETPMN